MKKRKIFQLLLGLGSSLLAAAIIKIFTPGQSWTAFAAWVIFFIAMQSPWIFLMKKGNYNCLNWFRRKASN